MKPSTHQCCDLCQGFEPTNDFYGVVTYCKDVSCVCHKGFCHTTGEQTPTVFSGASLADFEPTTETNFSLVEKHMQDVGDKTFNPTAEDVEYRFLKWAEGVDLDMYTARMSLEYFLTEISQACIEERLRIVSIAEGMKKPEDLIINKETLHLIKLYNAALSELLKAINE